MSTDRETTRTVRSWLEDGATRLPDRVLDAVLDQLPATPQRRFTWWPPRSFRTMNAFARFGFAAAAAAAVALVGYSYVLTANGGPNLGTEGLDAPPATATPQPTVTPIPAIPSDETLEAGTYRANPFIPIDVLVTVPEEWIGGGDWLLLGPGGIEPPDGMSIRFGSVRSVYANPLNRADGFLDPPVGPTVEDLVDAMVNHPDWPTSPATDVTIDGYRGKVVRMVLPVDLEIPAGGFLLFTDGQGGDRWAFEPGQIFDFYVIDVDGQRLVLELISYGDTPTEDLAARQAVIDTIEIEP